MLEGVCSVSYRLEHLFNGSNDKEIFFEFCDERLNEKQKEILWEYGRVAQPQHEYVLGTREAADFVGRKQPETIRNWIKEGKVRGWRNIEGLWWVPVNDLLAML